MKTEPMTWEEFEKTVKMGGKVEWRKTGPNTVSIGVVRKNVFRYVLGFSRAEPGEGLMEWPDYKSRTASM